VELLVEAGASVEVANNGKEAVEKLLGNPDPKAFQLVLMDIQMPEMDGFEATSHIRTDSRFKEIPIIAMTAHAMAEERQKCLEAGMSDHVAKPIDPDLMFETLVRWLGKKGAAAKPRTREAAKIAEPPKADAPRFVDIEDGLRRVGGNRRLYEKLLRQYIEGESDAVMKIRANLNAGDVKTAERMAHTIKGVSGNIGVVETQKAAAALEAGIKQNMGKDRLNDLLTRLSFIIDFTIGELEAFLAGSTEHREESPVAGKADVVKIKSIMDKLDSLIADNDGETSDFLESSRSILAPAFESGELNALEKAVGAFDFEAAAGCLSEMKKKI